MKKVTQQIANCVLAIMVTDYCYDDMGVRLQKGFKDVTFSETGIERVTLENGQVYEISIHLIN